MDTIKNRRSIRQYRPEAMPDDTLERVLEAARVAPSAGNHQPWKFVVVKDSVLRQKLVAACRNQKFVADAGVLIVACAPEADRRWNHVDCAIAVDHMTLVAHEEGLGTCWIGAFEEDEVRRLVQIPDSVEIVILLTLGYPAEEGRVRDRKPLAEIVCYDTYQ